MKQCAYRLLLLLHLCGLWLSLVWIARVRQVPTVITPRDLARLIGRAVRRRT